jgi:hypothetical protein
VRLLGATIGSDLYCDDATFTNPDGDALGGQNMTVEGGLVWAGLTNVKGAVALIAAQVGVLVDDEPSWQFDQMTYWLQGLRIDRFAGPGAAWTAKKHTEWIEKAQDSGPGIYEMVARWYRNVGRDADARHIAIAKQKTRGADFSWWWRRPLHRLWGVLTGYGYQSWRAAGLLAVFFVVGVAVFFWTDMTLAREPEVYAFNPWIYTADVLIPLIDLKQATQWAPDTTFGLWLMWFLTTAGWVLSLALVAAVSGLFRSTRPRPCEQVPRRPGEAPPHEAVRGRAGDEPGDRNHRLGGIRQRRPGRRGGVRGPGSEAEAPRGGRTGNPRRRCVRVEHVLAADRFDRRSLGSAGDRAGHALLLAGREDAAPPFPT